MDEKNKATEADAPKIATGEKVTIPPDEDMEAKIVALETEKENYRKAYLKEVGKNEKPDPDESEEDRIQRIVRKNLAEANIARVDTEKEALIKKLAKENKELKLAQLNRTDLPATKVGDSTGPVVQDTSVTPDQEKYFRETLKWGDKEIANYKKNRTKSGGR